MGTVVEVEFPQPPAAVYAYLADPARRPEWQSSLRRIEDLSGGGEVGTTWTDVTTAGVRPRMVVTVAEPPVTWAEDGTWRRIAATLRLDLRPRGAGTTVRATIDLRAPGLLRPLGWALARLAPLGVRADLRRAATLAGRGPAPPA